MPPRPPKVTVQIQDKDHGFRRMAAELGGVTEVTVGVMGEKAKRPHSGSRGATIGSVAFWHETGSGGMKQRSFVRAWMDKNVAMMKEDAAKAMQAVILGASRPQAFGAIGQKWVAGVRQFINAGMVRPENAAETIARKGHATPMLGLTGEVRDAVSYKLKLPTTKRMKAIVSTAAKNALSNLGRFNYDPEE